MKIRFDIKKKTFIVTAIALAVMVLISVRSHISILPAVIAGILYFLIKIIMVQERQVVEAAEEGVKRKTLADWIRMMNPLWAALELFFSALLTERMVQYLLLDAENRAKLSTDQGWLNVYCALAWMLLWLAITARPKLACMIGHISLMALAGVNYFVYQFRGNEFSFGDLKGASTGLSVASNYDFVLEDRAVYIIILSILYVALVRKINIEFKKKWLVRLTALAGTLVLSSYISVKSEYTVMESWEQKGTYHNGYILNFVLSIRDSFVSAPEDYSEDAIQALEKKYGTSDNTGSKDDPTIIVIMNESFANLNLLGDITTNEAVTPFLDSMSDNTIKGYTLSSVFGAKTPDSEWEFLTGNSMAFLPSGSVPYQQYVSGDTYSLVSTLKQRGYTCLSMHPYYGTGWSRDKVYPLMGFDKSYFIDDFDQTNIIRQYITDEELYNKIIDQYKAKTSNEKLFIMGVTMQNHGGYTDYYPNFSDSITMTNGYYGDVNQYLSLIHESDAALEKLITYFQGVDDKVEVVFFGDHQPSVNSNFYRQMNGKGLSGLTLDELEDLFKVPFFIWTNYDSQEKDVQLTSLNYLSTMALEQANIELPTYNRFLKDLMEAVPAMNSRAYYSSASNGFLHYTEASGTEKELLDKYDMLQYNNMFDKKDKSKVFFPFYSGDESDD